MRVRAPDQGGRPRRGGCAGSVRAADRRDHRLPVCRAVPVEEADRAGAGGTVRRPAVIWHGRRADREGRRAAGRLRGGDPRPDHRRRRGRLRRDRAAGRRQAPLGALRPHRQVHPAVLPPQEGHEGDGRDGDPARLRRDRRPRRLGTLRHLRRPGPSALLRSRGKGTAGRRRPGPRRAVELGRPGRRSTRRDAAPRGRRDRAAPRRHRPGRAGRPDPPLPLRRPDRRQGDLSPVREADEEAQRPGPQAARPPGRLPEIHAGLPDTPR